MNDQLNDQSPKPILFISPLPPPIGGIATWTNIILKLGLPNKTPITLVNTKLRGQRNIFDKASFNVSEITRTLSVTCNLLYQLIKKRPKVVHLSCALSPLGMMRDLLCAYLVRLFNIPIIAHYHGNLPDFDDKRLWGLSFFSLRQLMKITQVNIVGNLMSLARAQAINPSDKNILLPNFIEDEVFVFEKKPLVHNRLQVMFAGGITRAKGCAEIAALAAAHPQFDFHLYGKMHADMADCYSHPPNNIILHGPVDRRQLLTAMCHSDLLLFPSHSEGFPLTVLEAMTVGLPVIATPVGAIAEMVEHEKGGYIVARGDAAGLAQALLSLAHDPEKRTRMGKFNREKCDTHYRYSVVMRKLQQLYEQLTLCAV